MPAESEQAAPAPGPPPRPAPQQSDAAAIKLTRGTSCVLCQQRKVRCDKNKPCANCVKAGVECRIVPPAPPRRRKRRLQAKDLVERLRRYESLLSDLGVKVDAIGHHLRSDGPQLDDLEELEHDFEALKTSSEASASPSASSQSERPVGSWFVFHKAFRASERMLHDSSDEDVGGSIIHRAFDTMFSNHDGFPLALGGHARPVTDAHPSAIHILQLWQIYIDNINPLLKLTHVPSVQGRIIETTSRLDSAPKNMEALMFAIYAIAVSSLDEPDVQRMFGEPKRELLGRYCTALQQALLNAGFMRNDDFFCLQAYILYLYAVSWFVDPRHVFCLVGVAVRIAQRMGLHRDPGGFALPPFEVEQRRRLWWTIVAHDRRIGQITGSTVTALSSGCDCKMPLNVNDSDLHVDGTEAPPAHGGPTEMLFALTRTEFAMAVVTAGNSTRDGPEASNPDKVGPSSQGSGSQTPAPTIRLVGQDSPSYTVDGFCAHMEGTYLGQCDPKIPLHLFTLVLTRQTLCKMRVLGFIVRTQSAEARPLEDMEREDLVLQATQMLEYDNMIHNSESLQPFRWYCKYHFPLPAYMFLMQELRTRISGPVVDRAWNAIAVNLDARGVLDNMHSPMQSSFGSLLIKAWDAYEAAQAGNGRQVTPPRFITVRRERAEKRRRAHAESGRHLSLAQARADAPGPRDCGPAPVGSEGAAMPTPLSVDQLMASAGQGQQPMASSTAAPETSEMDWSYFVSSLQDMEGFHDFGGFGGYGGNPMGGVGGPGGWSMFGS